jgi:hypothetical protein
MNRTIKAFSVSELAIVLGLAGLVMSGIWVVAADVRAQQNIQNAVTELQTIKQALLDARQGVAFTVAGNTNVTSTLITQKIIPGIYAAPTDALAPWGGASYLMVKQNITSWGTLPQRKFRISYYNVPTREACVALLLQATACEAGQYGCPLQALTANAVTTQVPNALPSGWQAMSVARAQTMCNQNQYPTGTNSVEFDYSI